MERPRLKTGRNFVSSKFFITLLLISNLLLVAKCSNLNSNYLSTNDAHSDEVRNGHVNNTHHHDNDNHGDHSNQTEHGTNDDNCHWKPGDHGNNSGHHGIHVASWQFEYVKPYFIVSIFLIVTAISKLGFHKAEVLSSKIPESCLLILLGTLVGAILHVSGFGVQQFHLSSPLFFLILLPPIILESAYSLHDRVFFDNLGTILIYAVIGTIINCFFLAFYLWGLASAGAMGAFTVPLTLLQCLVFSSLIVAVDPVAVLAIFQEVGVNNVLYFLVFGESLLNDAVTVVLYNTMKIFNEMESIPASQVVLGFVAFFTVSFGGLLIGLLFGVFSSFLTRFTNDVKVMEPLAIFTLAYASYLTAELFHFSGIISIIGCGLLQVQYAFHNISARSLTTITYFSKTMSTTSDCIIFMFLGLALVRDNHEWHTGFILWVLALCLLLRIAVVYSLTFMANRLYRFRKIDKEEQFIMAYGGLRGAVAFSLAAMLDSHMCHKDLFVTATLAVIIFTVFFQGITIKPLVNLLRIRLSGKKVVSMYQEISSHVTDHMMAAIEEIIGYHGHNFIREQFVLFDTKYLKQWLQRNPESRDEEIMHVYNKMAMQIHYENLHLGGAPNLSPGFDRSFDQESSFDLYPCPSSPQAKSLDYLPCPESGSRKASFQNARKQGILPLDRLRLIAAQAEIGDQFTDDNISPQDPSSPKGNRILSIPQPSYIRQRTSRSVSRDQDRPMSMDEEAMRRTTKRRSTLFSIFSASSEEKVDLEVGDLPKIFIKSSQNYRQRQDRNLKCDEANDLVHHLTEKGKRTARYRRSKSLMSRQSSMMAESEDGNPNRYFLSAPTTPKRHSALKSIKEGETFEFTIQDFEPGEDKKPSAAKTSEQAPLLDRLVSTDSVFLSSETTENRDQNTSGCRAHLIRQDDIKRRSDSPPTTPPFGKIHSKLNVDCK